MSFFIYLETTTQKQKNYYRYIAEHKDTTKITMMVSSAISTTKIDVAKNLNEFSKFMFLWKEDRDSQIQVSANPLQPFYTGCLIKAPYP